MLAFRPTAPVLLAFVFATTPLAGCFVDDPMDSYKAFASEGRFAVGFAYDGQGIVAANSSVYIDVDEVNNVGKLLARGSMGGLPFQIVFDKFNGTRPFHSGGIARDFMEHGNSSVGDTTIPVVDLEMAGWGKAVYSIDGKVVHEPMSHGETWTAHFMVIRNGVRDDEAGGIYKDSNKSAPYDPLMPAEGHSVAGDYELHVVLRNNTGGDHMHGPVPVNKKKELPPTQPKISDNATNVFTTEIPHSKANLTLKLIGTGTTAGRKLEFVFTGPDGVQIGPKYSLAGASDKAEVSQVIEFDATKAGAYTVTVTGDNVPLAPGSYEITGNVAPPPALVYNFWWENLIFGSSALQEATAKGFAGTMPAAPTTSMMDNSSMSGHSHH